MSELLVAEQSTDPCEKCGAPVIGYIEQRCCDGRECACRGQPLVPCWCDGCWKKYDEDYHERVAEAMSHD